MSTQKQLTAFTNSHDSTAFETEQELRGEWGPTMDEPAHWIAPEDYPTVAETGIDPRELTGTGLTPQDFELRTPWISGPEEVARVATGAFPPFHPDDQHRPDRASEETQKLKELGEMTPESSESDAGAELETKTATGNDGGLA